MELDQVISFFDQNVFSADITCTWTKPYQAAQFDGFPDGLNPVLEKYIQVKFPNGFIKHQMDAIRNCTEWGKCA